MDRQLIERIALEVADSITAPFINDESMARFAHQYLARIDAERGKEVAFVYTGQTAEDIATIFDGYTFGTRFYAAPQPAPCPKCAEHIEYGTRNLRRRSEENAMLTEARVMELFEHAHGNTEYMRIKALARLVAKEAEVRAEAQEPKLLLNGKTLSAFGLEHLYDFQEATGCDTAEQYLAEKKEAQGPVALNIVRRWPEGFQERLQHVWLDVVGYTPNVMLWDLQRVLAEFGFDMQVREGNTQAASAPQQPAPCPAPLDESHYCPDCEALQAKVTELEKKWLEEQALNLAEEADYELMGQQLANAESMAGLDAEMNRELRAKVAELELYVGNLLARIHRDGGHYQAEHGNLKAVRDADIIVAKLNAQSDEQSAEIDHPKALGERDSTIAQQAERIADLEGQNEELCRKYQEHAGAKYALQDTIKQQAERIAELEKQPTMVAIREMIESQCVVDNAAVHRKMGEQAALIEKCEKALQQVGQALAWLAFGECRSYGEGVPLLIAPDADALCKEALAAIAAQKGNEK